MNRFTLLVVLAVSVGLLAGCSADKSSEIQTMPKSAAAPNQSPSMPGNIPDSAKAAISKAAPPPSGK